MKRFDWIKPLPIFALVFAWAVGMLIVFSMGKGWLGSWATILVGGIIVAMGLAAWDIFKKNSLALPRAASEVAILKSS